MLLRIWLYAVARWNERRAHRALLRAAVLFRTYVECSARSDKNVRRLKTLRRLRLRSEREWRGPAE